MSKRTLVASVVILLLIGCTAWAVWRHYGVDPKVQAILQKQANMKGRPTPQQREEMRAEEKDLTDAQRQQVREVRQQLRERRMQQQAAAYCALPPNQRTAYLDNRIAEMEKQRQEWAAARQQDGGSGGSGGGSGGGPGGGPPGGPGGPGGGRGGPGGRGPRDLTGQQRVQRMASMMDQSTPMERTQRQQFMTDMGARRQQLGLGGGFF